MIYPGDRSLTDRLGGPSAKRGSTNSSGGNTQLRQAHLLPLIRTEQSLSFTKVVATGSCWPLNEGGLEPIARDPLLVAV